MLKILEMLKSSLQSNAGDSQLTKANNEGYVHNEEAFQLLAPHGRDIIRRTRRSKIIIAQLNYAAKYMSACQQKRILHL